MKKNTVKAFTLVEMLIVIVIIGILIAALMPRMQAAQWRARDVSRKTALSQIQSAIVTSQWDKWVWPGQCDSATASTTPGCAQYWIWASAISWELTRAWMNSIPVDPLKTEEIAWLWSFTGNALWDYAYLVTTRNWTEDGWFILMAKTEVEWSSNWIVCPPAGTAGLSGWKITPKEDITNIHPCTKFTKDENPGTTCQIVWEECTYFADDQLRYIVLY